MIGTHHIGASTEQAQEAIAAEAVAHRPGLQGDRQGPERRQSRDEDAGDTHAGRPPPRPPGVLAHVFDHLRAGNLNVQETENIIFEGAEAAIARINLDGKPPADLAAEQSPGNHDILNLYVR